MKNLCYPVKKGLNFALLQTIRMQMKTRRLIIFKNNDFDLQRYLRHRTVKYRSRFEFLEFDDHSHMIFCALQSLAWTCQHDFCRMQKFFKIFATNCKKITSSVKNVLARQSKITTNKHKGSYCCYTLWLHMLNVC